MKNTFDESFNGSSTLKALLILVCLFSTESSRSRFLFKILKKIGSTLNLNQNHVVFLFFASVECILFLHSSNVHSCTVCFELRDNNF